MKNGRLNPQRATKGKIEAFWKLFLFLHFGFCISSCPAAVQVIGVQYREDQVFSEYDCFWHDGNYPTSCQTNQHGATVHVYLKNTGASGVTINDATVAGHSLQTVIAMSDNGQSSIYFHWDNPPSDILNAGEPVWWRFDPPTIPAGGVGQAAVRLRRVPTTPFVTVGVVTSGGAVTTNIAVAASGPQLVSLGYSEDLRKIYVHWRRNGAGSAAPGSVWLDGNNVTALTTTVGDPNLNFAASVISLPDPLAFFSYHVFQGVYADGQLASASQRAWTNKFIYATYGNFELSESYTAADWIEEATDHGVNNCQVNFGEVGQYMNTVPGAADARAHGFGYTIGDKTKLNVRGIDPDMWFLNDEPDAQEQNQSNTHCGTGLKIPCGGEHSVGTLVNFEIAHGVDELRALRPNVPLIVNLDNALKPESYFTWGPAMDILQFDNYYQRRLSDAYWRFSRLIPLYRKATYIYAHARIGCAGAEPNPSNQLLYSCEWKCVYEDCGVNLDNVWPFPTPEAKRIEVYYSLAGGSKGLGYWWFPRGYPSNGLADQGNPAARATWKEMGLLGNEIKTARPLIVTSHPVNLPLTANSNVWVRAMASGIDSLILYVVNDDYYNDFTGCHYNPVSNATVTATLPLWMQSSPTAFEVTPGGLRDVSTQLNGSQLQVNLGTLKLTRMIILTTNPQLRTTLQQRYDQEVRPGICDFAPEFCTNSPPSISQQPANRTVPPGGTTNFTVVASGTGTLSYQWQKDNSNLSNGGHYAGATTGVLTISNADANDAANYRCIVTNAYGSVTSGVATLTVTNLVLPPIITLQPANQSVTAGGMANFAVSAFGSEPLSYQWQKNNVNLGNGGHVTGSTTPTLTINNADGSDAGSYRCVVTNAYGSTNSASATLAVDLNVCSPGVLLRHGDMEDASAYSLCPDWESYSAGNGVPSWAKEAVIIHGGVASQKARNINGGTGSILGIRQTIDANVGDAFTFEGWVYPASQPAYQQVAMVAMWDGSTANPVANIGTWNISTGARLAWAQLQNLSGNATATNVTLFLDSRRITGSIEITAYWDDVLCYRAYVPPAPLLSVAGSTSLNVDLLPGCNTNGAAQFAVSIGGGAYTLGTHWVQANGTVSTTPAWQTDAAWAVKTVTGLTTGTAYTFKVQARYSGTLTQPTSLGAGSTLAPTATQQPPQLVVVRSGNALTFTWPELPSAHLEQAVSLTPPVSWAIATNQVSVVGGQKNVTLTPTGNVGYFRLVLD
jgi:hypothetical protein